MILPSIKIQDSDMQASKLDNFSSLTKADYFVV